MIAHDHAQSRVLLTLRAELKQQALLQISRSYTRRVELLNAP
jgi:hypothetical protein